MKGLILKDLIIIKNNLKKIYLAILLFSILPGFQNKDYFLMITTFIISMLLASQVIGTITNDENNGWNKAALSMPISIRKIVLSKYALTLIFSFVSVIALCLTGGIAKALFHLDWYEIFLSIIEGFLLGILFNGINIPVTYKYGAEASKYFMLLFIAVPIIFVYVSYFLNININQILVWFRKNPILMVLGCIVGVVFLIRGSIKVSIKNYRNRL